MFNTTLSTLLDAQAPLVKKTIITRPRIPWYTDEIKELKRQRRKAENRWRRTKHLSDLNHLKSIKNKTNYLMKRAKCDFYTKFVNDNSHNQKKLFAAKSCSFEPMPTPLMLECLNVLLPVITTVINLSLESSQFPDILEGSNWLSTAKKGSS